MQHRVNGSFRVVLSEREERGRKEVSREHLIGLIIYETLNVKFPSEFDVRGEFLGVDVAKY